MPLRPAQITGGVLVGGRSQRMGQPKSELRFADGTLLLARTVSLLLKHVGAGFSFIKGTLQTDIEVRIQEAQLVQWSDRLELVKTRALADGDAPIEIHILVMGFNLEGGSHEKQLVIKGSLRDFWVGDAHFRF